MNNLLNIYVYYKQKDIPAFRDEITFKAAVAREISLVYPKFNDYKVHLSPVTILPYEESVQFVLAYDKTVNGRRTEQLAGQLLRVLQNDQLSTETYKVSVRCERNILPHVEEMKKKHAQLDVVDKITVEDLKAFAKGKTASTVVMVLEYVTVVAKEPSIADLCKSLQGYRYMMLEYDKKRDKILKVVVSDYVADMIAEHIGRGKGVAVYE